MNMLRGIRELYRRLARRPAGKAVAILACLIPARRASKIDPSVTLKYE